MKPLWIRHAWTFAALMLLFFVYAGDPPPGVNEAHYLVKAKNFWDPSYLSTDLFASSGKAHWFFDVLFGWPTRFCSLETTAWIGRLAGWSILAVGLIRLTRTVLGQTWLAIPVAMLWIAAIDHGNLAGEWVVGGIEAKVPAYGLVLIGISNVAAGRFDRAWIWMGAAAALHVLTGGWAVAATLIARLILQLHRGRSDESLPTFFSTGLFLGGALSLLGVIPAAMMNLDGSGRSSIASMIYVYDRIPHHLLPSNFYASWYIRHSILVILTITLLWQTPNTPIWQRLRNLLVGVLCIEATGLLIGCLPPIAPAFAASLLRFYWFRLSDALIPLLLSLGVTQLGVLQLGVLQLGVLQLGVTRPRSWSINVAKFTLAAGVIAFFIASIDHMTGAVPVSVQNRLLGWQTGATADTLRQTWRDWRAVCRWAHDSTPPETMFLTPRHQQTFKWYSGRPEVVNWKDVPQDAGSLIQWKQRMQDIYPATLGNIKVTINYTKLRSFRRQYGARYMIVDHRVVPAPIPLQKVYPQNPTNNQTYAVYDLPR